MTVTTETIRTAARSSYDALEEFRKASRMRVLRPLKANAHQAVEAGYRICERLRSQRDRITALQQDPMKHWRVLYETGELTFPDHRWLELVIAISYAHADDVRNWCRRYGDALLRTNLVDAQGVAELNRQCPFPLTEDQLQGLSSELAETTHYLLRGVVYGEAAPRAGKEEGDALARLGPAASEPVVRDWRESPEWAEAIRCLSGDSLRLVKALADEPEGLAYDEMVKGVQVVDSLATTKRFSDLVRKVNQAWDAASVPFRITYRTARGGKRFIEPTHLR